MNTLEVKLPRWMVAPAAPLSHWPRPAPAVKPPPQAPARTVQLTNEETARFLRIVSECARIRRHYDIYQLLGGDVQHFLPHDILISAWGDFARWDLRLDLTSGLPGVRTAQLAHCRIDQIIQRAYARWLDAARAPVMLEPADLALGPHCHCAIHAALRDMRSIFVHGLHDQRSGQDSLFIALGCTPPARGRGARVLSFLDSLIAQIDAAFRRIPALPLAAAAGAAREGANVLDLSARELEVLESICRGKTNLDIAAVLDISPFTVKNHVQRIFRKIGVTNRTQAAARYTEAVRQAAAAAAGPADAAAQKTA
jgi:transcriptional regulator EpsA